MSNLTPQGVVDGVERLRARYPGHDATRAYAERFSWADTTSGQIRLFRQVARQGASLAGVLSTERTSG